MSNALRLIMASGGGGGGGSYAWSADNISTGGSNTVSSGTQGSVQYALWNSNGDGYIDVESGKDVFGIMCGGAGGSSRSWGGEGIKAAFQFTVPSGVTRMHVSVGGGGEGYNSNVTGQSAADGGFNGGGDSNSAYLGAGFFPSYTLESAGGGYTALFKGEGVTTPTKSHTNGLIVVGGGGGGNFLSGDRRGTGGWGGGIDQSGLNVEQISVISGTTYSTARGGNGTTTAGGAGALRSGYYISGSGGGSGGVLSGGNGQISDLDAGGGGGAGWYGGGGGAGGGGYSSGSGGGGSGKNNIGSDLIWSSNEETPANAKSALANRFVSEGITSESSATIISDMGQVVADTLARNYTRSSSYGTGYDGFVVFFLPS